MQSASPPSPPSARSQSGCRACREDLTVPEFTMAFQPIIDLDSNSVFAYEALVRPTGGGSALQVLEQITPETRYSFDQRCRVMAIEWAARLEMEALLSINFLPNAVYQPAACLRKTLEAARRTGFPADRLMFEVTEVEPSRDLAHLQAIFTEYRSHGMITAIDDFGAGHSGLGMLAGFQPDVIKLDMDLCRKIHVDNARQAIARATVALCSDLGIRLVCEGIESLEEAVTLRGLGVRYFQGYLFARPALERLPQVRSDVLDAVHAAHELALLSGNGGTRSLDQCRSRKSNIRGA